MSANRLATLGLACLALAMIGAVTLVTDYLLDTPATVIAGLLAAALFGTLWYIIPLAARDAPGTPAPSATTDSAGAPGRSARGFLRVDRAAQLLLVHLRAAGDLRWRASW